MTDYPAHFGYNRKSTVLPPSLQTNLQRLGVSLSKGRVDAAVIAAVVDGLCMLPVRDFSAASTDIVVCAGLYAGSHGRPWVMTDTKAQLAGMQRLMGNIPDLAFVLVFHGSGYLRQAALGRIDGPLEAPFLLAAVMYRLNDWVPEVRRTAVECTLRVFATTPVPIIIPAVIGLLAMRVQWQRGIREALVVDEVLSRTDVRAAMVTYLTQTYVGPVARVLRNLVRDARFDSALPSLVRNAWHPAVRGLALRTLIHGEARWPVGVTTEWIDKSMGKGRRVQAFASRPVTVEVAVEALIRQGASDHTAFVRKIAMQAIVDRPAQWTQFADVIEALSRDSSRSIREGMAYIERTRAQERGEEAAFPT